LTTGKDHWEPLLRARAIENQCYVLAPAQQGRHDDGGLRHSWGHAMIVDPWGTWWRSPPTGRASRWPRSTSRGCGACGSTCRRWHTAASEVGRSGRVGNLPAMGPPLLFAALAEAGMRSPYQQLKGQILSVVGLSKDAVHLYI